MISRYISSNKTNRETVIPRSKIWSKPTDQMDLWLDTQGYYRKHTAKDGSCLYRAVAEQIYLAQAFHLDVRRQCAEYAKRHLDLLSRVTHCTPTEYVDQIRHPLEAGGILELEIMSQMYRQDFSVFHEVGIGCQPVTNNGFRKRIMLCLSQDRHYDSVYTKQYISNAAFCQSVVYDMLYKGVFQLQEVDFAVKKMLHDKSSKYQRDPSSFFMNGLALRLEIRDSYVNVKELLNLGVTPFPYKVAKSLDPDIYRNVEYDTWNDMRRGMRYGMYQWNNRELQVGGKCLVKLHPDRICHAHIQDMAPGKGPVVVFVEELGEKMTVDFESLELLPQPPQPPSLPLPLKQLRQLQTFKALASPSPDSDVDADHSNDTMVDNLNDNDRTWQKQEMECDADNSTAKLKMYSEISKTNKKINKPYRNKSKDIQQRQLNMDANNQVEENSVVSSTICYQPQEVLSYRNEHFEGYSPQGYIQQEGEQPMEEDSAEPKPMELQPAMVCLEPQHYFLPAPHPADGLPHHPPLAMPGPAAAPPAAFCYLPHKSMLPDGSDLPLADVATLRFYYNYGVDHYSRGVRPSAPCYINAAVAYMPEPLNSPAPMPAPHYEQAQPHPSPPPHPSTSSSPMSTPDSAVVMSPVQVYPQRPDSLAVLPTTGLDPPTGFNPNAHNIAPRFKNKAKNMQGRSFEAIQQPEVTSTTNIPMPTHYVAPPVFYHPMECDPYCPVAPNYVEYGLYEPVFYPPPPLPPTHFIHPDALFYPHVVPAPLPTNV